MQTMPVLNHLAKVIYAPGINEQLNDDIVSYSRLKKSTDVETDKLGGKYVVFSIHHKRNGSHGARNEMEALPTPGKQGYYSGKTGLKNLYTGAALTGQVIRLLNTKEQAFSSAVDEEMKRLRTDLGIWLNRMIYGDGSGVISKATAVVTANAVVPVADVLLFTEGDILDLLTLPAGTSKATGLEVIYVDIDASTITLSTAVTTVVGDGFTLVKSFGKEWTGFASFASKTGILHDIDPAVVGVWKGVVDDGGGTPRDVSEGIFNKVTDDVKVRGGKTTAAYTTYGIQRAYANLLQQERSYVNVNGKFDGGYKALSYQTSSGEIPFIVERMAPKGKVWFMNEDEITIYRDADWDFMDYGGNGDKWRQVQDADGIYDAYATNLFQYSEMTTKRRNTHALVSNLKEQ